MTLPASLPLNHPRVERFRSELETIFVEAFDEGVHIGVLMANAHYAAAMILAGAGGSKEDFIRLADQAWTNALEECRIIHALRDMHEGKQAKA